MQHQQQKERRQKYTCTPYSLESIRRVLLFFPISNCGQSQNSFTRQNYCTSALERPFILIFGIILRACKDTYVCGIYVCFMSACVHRIIFLFVSHKFWLVIFVINQYYFRFSTRPNSIRDSTNTEFDLPRRLLLEIDLQRLDSTRLQNNRFFENFIALTRKYFPVYYLGTTHTECHKVRRQIKTEQKN